MKERDMRPAVDEWLQAQGMAVRHESGIFANADVVGVRFAERTGRAIPALEKVIVVELKLRDIAAVRGQARVHTQYPVQSYAAMPGDRVRRMKPGTLNEFRYDRVGLLAVDGDQVTVVVNAWGDLPQRLWRRVKQIEKAASEA
jgi:hypothetical protein